MDIEALARRFCLDKGNVSAKNLSADFADAYAASASGKITTLIVPNDYIFGLK